jgi:hypothetical protein
MKKLINYFIMIAIAFIATACHKEDVLTTLQPVSFTSTLKASANAVALTTKTDSTLVETFTWPAVVYPVKAHVTYTLQVDLPADTVGATAWANSTVIAIGTDVLTKTFKGADFNNLALNVGVPPNGTGTLVFRIKAYQDRPAYSSAVAVAVTTYKAIPAFSHNWSVLYLPGFYQGWSPGTAGNVAAEQTGIYEGFVYMPASTDPSAYHFKFTSAADWNHINYGNGATTGALSPDGTAGDLVLPSAGFYELVANTTTLTWSYTPMTWAIIGDATPGGWGNDTQMSYSATTGLWTVTAAMVSTGSFKFRANNAWSIDFGIDANGHLAYADNPAYPYNGTLNNLSVPSSGNYTITLDLRNPNNYNYTLKKN